jgi:hypothetical protein
MIFGSDTSTNFDLLNSVKEELSILEKSSFSIKEDFTEHAFEYNPSYYTQLEYLDDFWLKNANNADTNQSKPLFNGKDLSIDNDLIESISSNIISTMLPVGEDSPDFSGSLFCFEHFFQFENSNNFISWHQHVPECVHGLYIYFIKSENFKSSFFKYYDIHNKAVVEESLSEGWNPIIFHLNQNPSFNLWHSLNLLGKSKVMSGVFSLSL